MRDGEQEMGSPNSDFSLFVLRPGTESQTPDPEKKDWSRARLGNKMKKKKVFFWCVWARVSVWIVPCVTLPAPFKSREQNGPDEALIWMVAVVLRRCSVAYTEVVCEPWPWSLGSKEHKDVS